MSHEAIGVVIPAYNEALTIERSLQAVADQTEAPDLVMVVDNGSTDTTTDIIRASFPDVAVVTESRKGTGIACNTGFDAAITSGADIVMRTDADTAPRPNWVEATRGYMAEHPEKMIVGGTTRSLRDEHYRRRDEIIVPLLLGTIRYAGALMRRQPEMTRLAAGHNMAVRSEAFQAVGGFPDSAIDSTDEDLELLTKVYKKYGFDAIGKNPDMVVESSARRLRKLGFIGMLRYYTPDGEQAGEHRSRMLDGNIDIR